MFADDCALLFETREDMVEGSTYLFKHLERFGLHMHVGRGATASKTEAVYFPPPRAPHAAGDQSDFPLLDGFISFTDKFTYLGSILHNSLTSDADVDARISKARAAFGALQGFLSKKYLKEKCKGTVFRALVVSILLYGSESWCLREDQLQRLNTFYNSCVRRLCRVSMHQVIKFRISTKQLLDRLEICSIEDYYTSRTLRWAGHVVRMKGHRIPRRLLTGWVRHPRPVGAPQMTMGRTINKALTKFGITNVFTTDKKGKQGWRAIAQERGAWRTLTHPDPAVRAGKAIRRKPNKPKPKPKEPQGRWAHLAPCSCQSWNRASYICYCEPALGDFVRRP